MLSPNEVTVESPYHNKVKRILSQAKSILKRENGPTQYIEDSPEQSPLPMQGDIFRRQETQYFKDLVVEGKIEIAVQSKHQESIKKVFKNYNKRL